MIKAILYMIIGTLISFAFIYFLMPTHIPGLDWYYAFAFGWGWANAYYLDRPDFDTTKKLGLSFIGVAILVGIGLPFFRAIDAIPSVIQFSIIFVGYYLLASFKESKSLRR